MGQVAINGKSTGTVPLGGSRDDSTNVYCSGHGVYWVYYDATDGITNGRNTVVIETSQGEPGNKLDGRAAPTIALILIILIFRKYTM